MSRPTAASSVPPDATTASIQRSVFSVLQVSSSGLTNFVIPPVKSGTDRIPQTWSVMLVLLDALFVYHLLCAPIACPTTTSGMINSATLHVLIDTSPTITRWSARAVLLTV